MSEEYHPVIIPLGIDPRSPAELIEIFDSDTKLPFGKATLAVSLSVIAQAGYQERYNEVADSMVSAWGRARNRKNLPAENVGLRALGIMGVEADIRLGFRKVHPGETHYVLCYINPETYGPTMEAFATYTGFRGQTLVDMIK